MGLDANIMSDKQLLNELLKGNSKVGKHLRKIGAKTKQFALANAGQRARVITGQYVASVTGPILVTTPRVAIVVYYNLNTAPYADFVERGIKPAAGAFHKKPSHMGSNYGGWEGTYALLDALEAALRVVRS